jgi:hypothetical protein
VGNSSFLAAAIFLSFALAAAMGGKGLAGRPMPDPTRAAPELR